LAAGSVRDHRIYTPYSTVLSRRFLLLSRGKFYSSHYIQGNIQCRRWCHLVRAEAEGIHLLLSNNGTVSTKSRLLFSYLYHPIAAIGSVSIFLTNLKGLPFMNCPTIDQVSQSGKCRKSHKTSQVPKILRLMNIPLNIPQASAMGATMRVPRI
jgi:hypothetical protein